MVDAEAEGGETETENLENRPLDEPTEARVPKTLFNPLLPSKREVEEHNLTHLPYRNWCPVCVAAKGKEQGHPRVERGGPDEDMPEVGMDYDYYGDAEDSTAKRSDIRRRL